MIGIYGVAALAASRRTKEFGIRMALGAMRAQIIRLVLRSGVKQICSGMLLGICLTLGASHGLARLMKKAPFVLDTHDPLIYFVVCLLLVLAATVAMLIPTLRATAAGSGACVARRVICLASRRTLEYPRFRKRRTRGGGPIFACVSAIPQFASTGCNVLRGNCYTPWAEAPRSWL